MHLHDLQQLVNNSSMSHVCCRFNLLSTGLVHVVSTSCKKSANDKLQQSLILTDLLQLHEIDKFVATR